MDLQTLCGPVLQRLWDSPNIELDEKLLKTLSIRKGRNLEAKIPEDGTRPDCFFLPHPDTSEFRDSLARAHMDEFPDGWYFCPKKHTRLSCSQDLADWCSMMMSEAFHHEGTRSGYWGVTSSQLCERDDHRLRIYLASREHPNLHAKVFDDDEPAFAADPFFSAAAMNKPHIGCILNDANVPTDKNVLRSEIVTAIELLRHERGHSRAFGQTIPMMIYTIAHGNKCRATQFHFDGKSLLFRQSRVFNLGAPKVEEVLDDMLGLMMWMRCRPVGLNRSDGRR